MATYLIDFYKDRNGYSQPVEYIRDLKAKAVTVKSARIELNRINAYLIALGESGTRLGEDFVKYIGDDIWELRPRSTRLFFALRRGNTFIILHYYVKKSQKMNVKEFNIAKDRLRDFDEREKNNEIRNRAHNSMGKSTS